MLNLRALISQKNENDPDLTISENDFGTITCQRDNTGVFSIISSGMFTEETHCFISNSDNSASADYPLVFITREDDSHIKITTYSLYNGNRALTDGLLNNASVMITSYPQA